MNEFRTEWNKSVIRSGRFTMLLAMVCSFLPNIALYFFYGARPNFSEMMSGWGQIAAAYVGFYIIEPITYGTVLGTAGSYVTNIVILTITVFFGVQILSLLPAGIKAALSSLILPALFGAVLMQFAMKKPIIVCYALPLVLVVRKFIKMPSWGYILVAVFGSLILSKILYKAKIVK